MRKTFYISLQTLVTVIFLATTGGAQANRQNSVGTDRPLSGFRYYMRIVPPKYPDGRTDFMNLAPYAEQGLAKQGWVILNQSDLEKTWNDRAIASATAVCGIGHQGETPGSFRGPTITLTCADILGRQLFSITGGRSGFSFQGILEAGIRDILDRLKKIRPRYDATQTVDLLDTLPNVETVDIKETDIDRRIAAGQLKNPIEGIWSSSGYRIAILAEHSADQFVVVLLEALESKTRALWQPGMVKGRFSRAADDRTYIVSWNDFRKNQITGQATLANGRLSLTLNLLNNQKETDEYVKLRPRTGGMADPPPTSRAEDGLSLSSTGTGFVVGTELVATNYHVIRDARQLEFFLPDSQRALKLDVVISDPTNDLAILKARLDRGVSDLPRAVRLADVDPKLGEEAIVIGFPLGSILGASHKVTTGVVSSLDGLDGDPRMVQVTAPIQPGSSGSPVFDTSGRVIGIVTSTLDALETIKADGHIPQNVNFAIKADYLALLLKRAAARNPGVNGMQISGKTADIVNQVRSAVGQIRAFR